MVDVSCSLSEKQFARCGDLLEIQPGGWAKIESSELLHALLAELDIPSHNIEALHRSMQQGKCAIAAGSSILGVLSAVDPGLRRQSMLASGIAINEKGNDPFFDYFHNATTEMDIRHVGQTIPGRNPMGLVLTTVENKEKMLATFLGVSPDFDAHATMEQVQTEYVIVDSYELQHGTLGTSLEKIIASGRFKVALSLGNKSILDANEGALQTSIRRYIGAGQIHVICGNREEYLALFPETPLQGTLVDWFREHPVHNQVPFSLLTDGAEGLVGNFEGNIIAVPAEKVSSQDIVNTSGAGDTAMGAFCDGIIRGRDLPTTLRRATTLAAKVLQTSSSRLS